MRKLVLAVVALFIAWGQALWLAPTANAAGKPKPLGFGREVIVDHQRVTGEPSLAIDSQDRVYVSAPFGFSTTASYVWRSTDHGVSFHLVPGNVSPYGKPNVTCWEVAIRAWRWTPQTVSIMSTCRA